MLRFVLPLLVAAPVAAQALVVPPSTEQAVPFAVPLVQGARTLQEVSAVPGDTLRLSDLAGRVVVLNLWATWCAPCVRELPELARLHREIEAEGGSVVAVAEGQSDPQAIGAFAARAGATFPVAFPDAALPPRYGPRTVWPSTFVLDRQHRIRLYLQGPTTYNELAPLVRALLAEEG